MKSILAFFLVFFVATVQAGNDKLIGRCEMEDLKFDIYYTNRMIDDTHVVSVVITIPGQRKSKRDFLAQGWDSSDGKQYFHIQASFGLALLDGENADNKFYVMGVPPDDFHCKNDLSAVLADFPN